MQMVQEVLHLSHLFLYAPQRLLHSRVLGVEPRLQHLSLTQNRRQWRANLVLRYVRYLTESRKTLRMPLLLLDLFSLADVMENKLDVLAILVGYELTMGLDRQLITVGPLY